MGHFAGVSAESSIYAASSDYIDASLDMPSVPADLASGGSTGNVDIGDFALLGSHTVVLPGVQIPVGFATGAQTVVRARKYDSWTQYGGPSCRRLTRPNYSHIESRPAELFARVTHRIPW